MKTIPLTKNQIAKVDDSVYDKVSQHTWHALESTDTFYAASHINGEYVYMHHFLFGKPTDGSVMDHIDRDGTNNQKENVRLATRRVNAINSKLRRDNKSGYKGVTWNKKSSAYQVYYRINGKMFHVGFFKNLDVAIAERKKIERWQENPLSLKAQQLLQAHKAYEESLQHK